jgi:hypothetical protein
MRKILLLTVIACGCAMVGCTAGVAKTVGDRNNAYRRTFNMDMRQIVDDWDKVWLADRQYRLTRYYTR